MSPSAAASAAPPPPPTSHAAASGAGRKGSGVQCKSAWAINVKPDMARTRLIRLRFEMPAGDRHPTLRLNLKEGCPVGELRQFESPACSRLIGCQFQSFRQMPVPTGSLSFARRCLRCKTERVDDPAPTCLSAPFHSSLLSKWPMICIDLNRSRPASLQLPRDERKFGVDI
jgi:hypothetical protein